MNNKIEIGQYIKIKKSGELGKILSFVYDDRSIGGYILNIDSSNYPIIVFTENDFETSEKLINIIEIGDIIVDFNDNIYKIYNIDGKKIYISEENFIYVGDIKQIMSKEKFKATIYNVD